MGINLVDSEDVDGLLKAVILNIILRGENFLDSYVKSNSPSAP